MLNYANRGFFYRHTNPSKVVPYMHAITVVITTILVFVGHGQIGIIMKSSKHKRVVINFSNFRHWVHVPGLCVCMSVCVYLSVT